MIDFDDLEDYFNKADDDFSKIETDIDKRNFVYKYGKDLYDRRLSRAQDGDKTLQQKYRIERGLNKPDGRELS